MTPFHSFDRREFLRCTAAGCAAGSFSLHSALSQAAEVFGGRPLVPQRAHFEPKAKHLVFVFLTGGFSHVDTFDYKPKLTKDDGKMVPGPTLRESSAKPLLGSPF